MNWGQKIILAYLTFILLLVVMAYRSFNAPVDLVAKDYYRQELAYQDRIEEIKNENNLEATVEISVDKQNQRINLIFPQEMREVQGTVHLYRPSDAELDQKWSILLDQNGVQSIDASAMPSGRWSIQIQWEHESLTFYKQTPIYLP